MNSRPPAAADAIVRAHETFLRTMAETHRSFLDAVSGQASSRPRAEVSPATSLPAAAANIVTAPVAPVAPVAPASAGTPAPSDPSLPVTPVSAGTPAPSAAASSPVAPASAGTSAGPVAVGALSPAAVIEVVLKTVADKTGYPREMLEPTMLLEGDLGIDSIKRVEILSAVQKQLPGLPAVDAKVMGGLQTLQAISDYLVEQLGGLTSNAVAPASAGTPAGPVTAATLSPAAVIEVVLKTVAEKTGYPREMLEPTMLLEGDLGIDSIKRVEILSAVQKQLPGLPPVDAKVMGGLQTLQAISDYLVEQLGGLASNAVAPASAGTPAGPVAAGALSPAAVIEVVLKTVAEKTGYPREMLEPTMLLEGDLGIDSIKRVEILSAVQKQLPGLPPVDAKVMAGLQTLQAISDYLIAQLGGGTTATKLVQIAVNAPIKSALPVKRYGVRATPAAAAGLALPGLHRASRVVITDDQRGIAQALRDALSGYGIAAEVVADVPADATGVILLEGLRECRSEADEDTLLRNVFAQACRAAGTLASQGGFLVTVQDTDGDFGLRSAATRPWSGALAGLAKSAAKEWPKATVRALDLASRTGTAATVAARLCHELLHGGSDVEIGLAADGSRVRPEVFEAAAGPGASPLNRDAVVVATGGGRGVTASTLIALAQAHRPKMALLGRTALRPEPAALAQSRSESELRTALLALEKAAGRTPTPKALASAVADVLAQREIHATLTALRAAGSQVEYLVCDSTDAAAMQATLTQVRSTLGPIRAIVHGAGVLADKLIADKTPEQFARVVDTKVRGLRALLHATATDDLAAVILFSSVAGRFGNRGQADYAMANEFLNKAAHAIFAARQGRCLVRSINWGPWEGGMVTPELREHFAGQGIGVIPREEGALILVRELSGPATREAIEVVVGAGRLDLGAGAAGESRPVGEIAVSVERFPAIGDHVVKGRPVVPIALAAEWLLGAASSAAGATATGLKDLQVLKALVLPDSGGSLLVQLQARSTGAALEVVLADPATRQAHYKATAVFTPPTLSVPSAQRSALQPFGYPPEGAYDQRLFHGPEFQVIRTLRGWTSAEAELEIENRAIQGGDWQVGPALLDGALQAAALWTLQTSGRSSLPMRIAELSLHRPAQPGERLTCRLTGADKDGVGSVADVLCVDGQGAVVCALRGVECYHVDSYWHAVTA